MGFLIPVSQFESGTGYQKQERKNKMSTKKMKKAEKAFEVREISEAERKMLKDGNVPGRAIDLKMNSALPPQVMDEIVQNIVGPLVASTVKIVQGAYLAGRQNALNELKAMVMGDCRAKGHDTAECKKCKDRKACEAAAKERAEAKAEKPVKGKKAK